MKRKSKRHHETRYADEATPTDETMPDAESADEITNDSMFGIPGTVTSEEYIDLELARINPPA